MGTQYPGPLEVPRPAKVPWEDVVLFQGPCFPCIIMMHCHDALPSAGWGCMGCFCSNGSGVPCAGFGWESCKQSKSWWRIVESNIAEIKVSSRLSPA